uniref:Mab-21-like HhH/H2TH-like domain-containing protein n=1 Tax=Glossina brevipalpis TaxID=37001 RepID=A0A1A9X3K0_9MUSC
MEFFGKCFDDFAKYLEIDGQKHDFLRNEYEIIYEYLIELLRRDILIGPFVVFNKTNGKTFLTDLMLDLSRSFYIKAFARGLYLSLNLANNSKLRNHQFFNSQGYLNSSHLKSCIRLALCKGFEKMGCFVRGPSSDIYELTMDDKDIYGLRVIAASENNILYITLRVLVKFTTNLAATLQPYPASSFKRDWLPMLPSWGPGAFDVSMPHMEERILKNSTNLIAVIRLLEHMSDSKKHYLKHLKCGFWWSAFYDEISHKKWKYKIDPACLFIGIIQRARRYFESKKYPFYWNANIDMLKYFTSSTPQMKTRNSLNNILNDVLNMKRDETLCFEDILNYFDLNILSDVYHIDNFGPSKYFE